jgi:nucleoside-diphosphate-sugar epimerase
MLLDAAEAGPVPRLFVAVTVNVYAVSDCNPVTVTGDEAPVPVNPPGLDVTV